MQTSSRSQLRRLVSNLSVGPRAFFLSCRLSDFPMGLQLLERARGTIWMQQLSMRDPQIDDIPRDMAMKLETILREINQTRLGHVTNLSVDKQAFIPDRDILHEQRNQLQHILHEVRGLPGLQDFMRGPDGATLLTAATRSPIVVLVADRKECRALIIPSSHEAPSDVVLSITQAELLDLTSRMSALHSRGGQESDADGAQRALGIAKVKSASSTILAKLWQAVVKPVLAILQLEVSAPFQLKAEHDSLWCICHRKGKAECDAVFTGAPPAPLCLSQCTRRASTRDEARSAAQTIWSPRMHRLSPRCYELSETRRLTPQSKSRSPRFL
jgi:hypothetical protein